MSEEIKEELEITEEDVPEFIIEVGQAEITKQRVLAAVRGVLMIITSICSAFGFAFDVDSAYQIVLVVLMVASMVWGYWKNNNWTSNAIASQAVKDAISK